MSQNEVVVATFTFEVPTGTKNTFYSVGDESSFFQWIYQLSGYKSCVGSGKSVRIDFEITKMDRETLVDLVAIFRRYNLDLPSLRPLASAPDGAWFASADKYWHRLIFGERPTGEA